MQRMSPLLTSCFSGCLVPMCADMERCCRFAGAAGVGIATLGLALSANAANVKLGAAGGALVFEPAEVTIKSGETVTWTNNIGFPHNVVFDEDNIPVSLSAHDMQSLEPQSCICAARSPTAVLRYRRAGPCASGVFIEWCLGKMGGMFERTSWLCQHEGVFVAVRVLPCSPVYRFP